jgi:hypothetical protein
VVGHAPSLKILNPVAVEMILGLVIRHRTAEGAVGHTRPLYWWAGLLKSCILMLSKMRPAPTAKEEEETRQISVRVYLCRSKMHLSDVLVLYYD